LLASGVSLKQIQEWLGHSDFSITANTYAHLEFAAKLAAAGAMTWIERTSLAQPHSLLPRSGNKKQEFAGEARASGCPEISPIRSPGN